MLDTGAQNQLFPAPEEVTVHSERDDMLLKYNNGIFGKDPLSWVLKYDSADLPLG